MFQSSAVVRQVGHLIIGRGPKATMSGSSVLRPGVRDMIFFVRGRGHGHAIPDMAIADELAKLRNDIQVTFVSYGTGAATLIQHERPVVDLQMPDSNSLWETVVRAGQVISQMRPVLVVSHEEFAVLPLAKLFDVPAVFITEWFIDPEDLLMQALR